MLLWPRKQEVSESPLVLLGFASLESGKDKEGRGWLHRASLLLGSLFQLVGPRCLTQVLGTREGHCLRLWTSRADPAPCQLCAWALAGASRLGTQESFKTTDTWTPQYRVKLKGFCCFQTYECVCVCVSSEVLS